MSVCGTGVVCSLFLVKVLSCLSIWHVVFTAGGVEIDFEEFLAIYRRIFMLSKSTVSEHVNDITRQPPKLLVTPTQHRQARVLALLLTLTDHPQTTPHQSPS